MAFPLDVWLWKKDSIKEQDLSSAQNPTLPVGSKWLSIESVEIASSGIRDPISRENNKGEDDGTVVGVKISPEEADSDRAPKEKEIGFGSCSEEGQTSSGTEESGEEEVDEGDSETAKTEAPLLLGNEEILETKQGPKILSLQVHTRYST
ncbi:hypothetical protein U1Q18_032698 [Sarracenia purpurea var. burkii]